MRRVPARGRGLPTLFLPLTYRGAELDGAEEHLVGTTEHSELGPRWVYDGCADPVFIGELVRAVLTGGTGVDHEYDIGNGPESLPTNAQVQGSGNASDVPLVEDVGCHDEGPLTIVNAARSSSRSPGSSAPTSTPPRRSPSPGRAATTS